ncbi:response regulator [Paraferrimonas sedimenticola]|uniref:Response regulatory domain-containing protein n=1 Tax=Paraferrimonas sedimenticola TaxID=375674 RepID=A0AA37RUI6_9GAMM|nr:response regulator [Paraferrimonas sedimenticola]GLP94792.1 hypothetical protein GCM10007895_00980 [Paraferrimonas sedimenticola]
MSIRLLLAEDDADLRETLTEALEFSGFEVSACEDAEQAIAVAQEQVFDMALLDMVMPGMSGIDAIGQIRLFQPTIGVVITTAFGTVDTAVDAMKHGAAEFLTKPFDMDSLCVTLKRVEAQRRQSPKLSGDKADKVFSALANPIRRETLLQLRKHGRLRFMDLCRLVHIDNHTKFNFHVRQLKNSGLVEQTESKIYFLTTQGKNLCASLFEEENA